MIESDFRSSKMAQIVLPKWPSVAILKKNCHFVKTNCLLMARNVIESDFRSCSHFVKTNCFEKAIESDFRSSKMAAGSHFLNKFTRVFMSQFHVSAEMIFYGVDLVLAVCV